MLEIVTLNIKKLFKIFVEDYLNIIYNEVKKNTKKKAKFNLAFKFHFIIFIPILNSFLN